MAVTPQKGFEYEKNAATVLKKHNLVPKGFVPAGAGHDQPDLLLEHKKIKAGCELKITAASAGSLVLKYDVGDTRNPWKFNDIDKRDEEKLFIRDLAVEVGFFKIVNKKWNTTPLKFLPSKLDNKAKYEKDKVLFPDIKGEITAKYIEQYYNKKATYYVNVGTHGFYRFGSKNPLKLKDVPNFADCAKSMYRARVQYKGGGNYQFTFEMNFTIPVSKKSPFNIAPVDGKTVKIITREMDLSCFY